MSASSRQMMRSLLSSASRNHVARSHLFLQAQAGLRRNRFWKEIMDTDILVFDFQDGCPPDQRANVVSIELQTRHLCCCYSFLTS
jgi:hypothetical protein